MLKNQINVVRSLINLKSSTQQLFFDLDTLLVGEGREDEGYDSLSRGGTQLYEKIMETLTLKGAFIGFPDNLK